MRAVRLYEILPHDDFILDRDPHLQGPAADDAATATENRDSASPIVPTVLRLAHHPARGPEDCFRRQPDVASGTVGFPVSRGERQLDPPRQVQEVPAAYKDLGGSHYAFGRIFPRTDLQTQRVHDRIIRPLLVADSLDYGLAGGGAGRKEAGEDSYKQAGEEGGERGEFRVVELDLEPARA